MIKEERRKKKKRKNILQVIRVIFLENGKIIEEAKSEDFFTHPKSERAKDFLSKVMH